MIRLVLEDNGTFHDDLIFKFADHAHRGNSCYFAIDLSSEPQEDSIEHARRTLYAMLNQWLEAIASAGRKDTVYLPFDLSDQCTAWIRCKLDGDHAKLDIGWSDIEGHSFHPADFSSLVRNVPDFSPIKEAPPIESNRASLLAAIRDNIEDYA